MAKRSKSQLKSDATANFTSATDSITFQTMRNLVSDLADSLAGVDDVNTDEDINDAIQTALVQGTNITLTKDDAANTVTISATDTNTQRTDEEINDLIQSTLVEGTNITLTKSDVNNTVTISATQRGAPTKAEIEARLTAGSNITIEDDPNDSTKLRIVSTDTNTQRTDEEINDLIQSAVVAGTNVTVDKSDSNNTVTINATDTNTQRSDEEINDLIQSAIVAGTNVTLNKSDANNTVTINSTQRGAPTATEVNDVITAGSNITVETDPNDSNKIRISSTDTNTQRGAPTKAEVYTQLVSILQQGSNITLTQDNSNNQLTIASTGGGGGGSVTFTWPSTKLTDLDDTDEVLVQDSTDSTTKAITFDDLKKALATIGFQFSNTTEEDITTTSELPFFNDDGNRRNISVSDFKSSLGIETETFRNLIEFTQTSVTTGTNFRTTGVAPTIYDEKIYEMSFIPATTANGNPVTNPDVANRSTYRDTGANLKDALKVRTVGTNSIAADLTLTDQGASRSIRVAWLSDGTILLDPQNWPGIFTMRVVEHITRSTDLPDMPTNGNFEDAEDGSTLKKVGDSYTLDPVFEQVFEVNAGASAIFANTNQNPVILPEKQYRIRFVPTASNDAANSGSLTISGTDLEDDLQTRAVGNNSTSSDLTLNNDGATRNYRLARLANGTWLFDNQSVAGTLTLESGTNITRISDLEGMPTAKQIDEALSNQALVKNGSTGNFDIQTITPDFTFDVIIPTNSRIVDNCYVVQPEDHGQLIALDPKATVLFCIFPQSLWNTTYNFKAQVTLDAAPNGLVRIAVPNFIGRPNNASQNGPSLVKQNNASSGLPTALRYPNNSAPAVNYIGYDYLDLWHARDWVKINMVNSAGWCGLGIENLERNNPPQNPTGAQILGNATQSFSASITNPSRTISVTKFRLEWEADNT